MKELTVVVPTYNERLNITPFLDRLAESLRGISYEVIFVDDDSPDGTAEVVRALALGNESVRIIHRIGRRGLASACLEGMLASAAPYVCVMDADMQHDEKIVPIMLQRLKKDNLDVVVGSRNVQGGSMGAFAPRRVFLSSLGKKISATICRCQIEDPMSGFFILTRALLIEVVHDVSSIGFKILVDLLASAKRPLRLVEVPYEFRNRERGESKLDLLVGLEYLQLVIDKLIGRYVPASFVLFALVGSIGVIFYTIVFWLLLFVVNMGFGRSQILAAVAAMTTNFLLNNLITYRDRRLWGWRLVRGLLLFYVACSVGLIINWQIAKLTHNAGLHWLLAGFAGLVVGSVWNYGATNVLTWRASARRRRTPLAKGHPFNS